LVAAGGSSATAVKAKVVAVASTTRASLVGFMVNNLINEFSILVQSLDKTPETDKRFNKKDFPTPFTLWRQSEPSLHSG
jgi:hypothetical protein